MGPASLRSATRKIVRRDKVDSDQDRDRKGCEQSRRLAETVGVWRKLSGEIWLHVFAYLPVGTLLEVSRVSKAWEAMGSDEKLWHAVYMRR